MSAADLWPLLTKQLRDYAEFHVRALRDQMLPALGAASADLDGRLLAVVEPPPGNPFADLIRQIVGDLHADSQIRVHGWRRDPAQPDVVGLALVLPAPGDEHRYAIVALTPGPTPGNTVIDAVVSPGEPLSFSTAGDGWSSSATVDAPTGWDVSSTQGVVVPGQPAPTSMIQAVRTTPVQVGMNGGPGLKMSGFTVTLKSSPNAVTVVEVTLEGLEAALLPPEVAQLVGAAPTDTADGDVGGPVSATVRADHVNGVSFAGAGLHIDLPVRLKTPGVQSRGTQIGLVADGDTLRVELTTALTASLPGLPLRATVDRTGFAVPLQFPQNGLLGLAPTPEDISPDGIGVDLTLPPVSGAGHIMHKSGVYSGLIAADLGVIAVSAVAQFSPPENGFPTSFLVMLGVVFPPPGIQLSFGFALDAVGGLVGINHRVDIPALRRLVSDGHADRVLFPDNIGARADEVIDALSSAFPADRGRFVIAPMVRLTWGARLVSLSGALILDLPAPVQAIILGRLVVSVPDPVVPLIHLQASVLGQFDPGIPQFEILVSLAGSWIVGLAVRGEMYLLVRGGEQPEFVLSAGGFHPRYIRPARVPALARLDMDLQPGPGYGMRIQAYFALTSNAVQFGGQLHLEAMIAKCGIEGWLGLDALFRYEPTFCFSVAIRAGVAVRAFGHRLLGIALSFTLEGPQPWHAFGTGSVTVLFWDASLDFDIRWGSPPAVAAPIGGERIADELRAAIAEPKAWIAQRPASERTGLRFTDDAEQLMAAGTLIHPDATVRITQSVIPLNMAFTRYARSRVVEQQWSIRSVQIWGTTQTLADRPPPTEQFVRGEFFDLTEDEQLTAPATVTVTSGTEIVFRELDVEPGHLVDDHYETDYEPPLPSPASRPRWRARYADETTFSWRAAERIARWRSAAGTTGVQISDPRVVLIASAAAGPAGQGFAAGAEAPSAVPQPVTPAVDAWQMLHDQMRSPDPAVHLFESWEVPQ